MAVGKTTSAYKAEPVILKSNTTNRSSFPTGASSLNLTSSGFKGEKSAITPVFSTPNICFKKYSCPFAELEIRLDLHTNKLLGKFTGFSGSCIENSSSPLLSFSTTYSFGSFPEAFASSASFKLLLLNCG